MTHKVRLCRFTFRGGPLDGQEVALGEQPCDCCGEPVHPTILPYGTAEGIYRREKESTVFDWLAGYSVISPQKVEGDA